jgi:hypothetical protein
MLSASSQSQFAAHRPSAEAATFYPEECRGAAECTSCVRSAAAAVGSFVEGLTAEGAVRLFRKMYSHPACLSMEHAFLHACCAPVLQPRPALVQINSAA